MKREVDLVSYLPDYLKVYQEIEAALSAENREFEIVQEEADKILNNSFIDAADKTGIARFEKLMGIDSYGSLEERRFRCKVKWNEQQDYTLSWLREQLGHLCGEDGYKMLLQPERYSLMIQVALKSKNNVMTIADMVKRIIPQNMVWDVSLLYNQHITLKAYTHRQLSKYTYGQLRNEVLNDA